MYCADSPILAPPRATPEQAIRYILQRFPEGHYTPYDISNVIVPAYFEQGTALGVEPVGAIAQAVHEGFPVSWWSARPRRNPAGIGVTGRTMVDEPAYGAWVYHNGVWEEGCSFADWVKESIPAHLGRLLAYSVPVGQGTAAQRACIARALVVRTLPQQFRGIAPTYKGLENRWAVPGRGYAERIVEIINAICNTKV